MVPYNSKSYGVVQSFGVVLHGSHGATELRVPDSVEPAESRARAGGCAVETVTLDATHAFDQPDEPLLAVSPMRRDPALTADSLDRMERIKERVEAFGPVPAR